MITTTATQPDVTEKTLSKIHIATCGLLLVAETVPAAPRTVDALLSNLPFTQKFAHVKWSGDGIWVPFDHPGLTVAPENLTSRPSVGDVLFYQDDDGDSELILAYGPFSLANKMGPLQGSHFLSIVEGQQNLRDLGRKVLAEGLKEVCFSRA